MKQTILTIIKENFPVIFAKFEAKPFMILTLVFISTSVFFCNLWYKGVEAGVKNQVKSSVTIDSLKNEINNRDMIIYEYKKYDDVNAAIDSTLKTLIINNLIKKN